MRDATHQWRTYLVEHYAPGMSSERLYRRMSAVERAARDLSKSGKPVRYVRSTIVPADEAILAVFEAASEEIVRTAYAKAAVDLTRISVALTYESEGEVQ